MPRQELSSVLENEQQKIKFLTECQEHIKRIFNSDLTDIEKQKGEKIDKQNFFNTIKLRLSNNTIYENIPKSIELVGVANNYKMGKLLVLTSIYNAVANAEGEKIDLREIYNGVKFYANIELQSNRLPDADTLMKTHRNDFLRNSFLGKILSFIWTPKSTSFLKETGFFGNGTNEAASSNVHEDPTDAKKP